MKRNMTSREQRVKERIINDLANHTITVKHHDGLYGHWRCQKPGEWNMGFDIITWPGSLCYTGDMGDYLFQRTADMIAFMRGSCMSYSYAAEKCVAHDGRIKEWSEEQFDNVLAERLAESAEFTVWRNGKSETMSVEKAIADIKSEYENYNSRHDADKAMYESGLWDDMPRCEDWTFHFLWCLHALKWFCERVEQPQNILEAAACPAPSA